MFKWKKTVNSDDEVPFLGRMEIPRDVFDHITLQFVTIGHLFHNRDNMLESDRKIEYEEMWEKVFIKDKTLAVRLWSTTIQDWRNNKEQFQSLPEEVKQMIERKIKGFPES